jgi:hypothetical protein
MYVCHCMWDRPVPGKMFACARQISYYSDWLRVGAVGWIRTSPIPDRLWGHSSLLKNGNRRPLLLGKAAKKRSYHILPTSAEIWKACSYTSNPSYIYSDKSGTGVASHTVYSEIHLLGMAANYHIVCVCVCVCVMNRTQSGHLPQLHLPVVLCAEMMRLLRYIMTGCYIVSLKRKFTGHITENYEAHSFIT